MQIVSTVMQGWVSAYCTPRRGLFVCLCVFSFVLFFLCVCVHMCFFFLGIPVLAWWGDHIWWAQASGCLGHANRHLKPLLMRDARYSKRCWRKPRDAWSQCGACAVLCHADGQFWYHDPRRSPEQRRGGLHWCQEPIDLQHPSTFPPSLKMITTTWLMIFSKSGTSVHAAVWRWHMGAMTRWYIYGIYMGAWPEVPACLKFKSWPW